MCGIAPSTFSFSRAVRSGEAKRISSSFSPSTSASVTSKRQDRCWFCTSAIRRPFSTTVAAVSSEAATRSTRSAPAAVQSKRVA